MTTQTNRPAPVPKIKEPKQDTATSEQVRDILLQRVEQHFNADHIKSELIHRLDVVPAVYTRLIQFIVEKCFPEAFDLDVDAFAEGKKFIKGIVPRGGLERVGKRQLRAYLKCLQGEV